MEPKKKRRQLLVSLEEQLVERLELLAASRYISRSAVLRQLIAAAPLPEVRA